MTEQVDRAIGLILDGLDEGGMADNTLVIFTSDHGDGCASHRWAAKNTLYEEPMRVPFIVRFPGKVPAGVTDETHLVSGLDVLPTLCDYAGLNGPATHGRSLRSIIEDASSPWRDYLVAEVTGRRKETGDELRGRMVRAACYKYNVYDAGENREELFDLEADPGEMRNLAGEAAMRGVRDDLRAKLHEWIERTKDPFTL
jgi:arylsulfatase A-like enzyme